MKKLNILLVDDNAIMQLIQSTLVKGYGHDVTTAGSGEEAMQMLANQAFDLVLMDCQMPGMDGMQTTQKLRQQGNRTPIIALTGNDTHEDRAACQASGMDGFLAKPMEKPAFEREVARFI
ncbi:response regulator [Thiosulfativibrio zosterae]|uniref:Response regulatory domain-containing protein n=1 Tax=Thiosulfativibrio zosterae TaxID=2675053 RepID=A0A6F8PK05_9GAMM|nr:response regulator [Thiosulfativibrio zosterae]BBP42433.1 hypothetical protein THMIRHAT_01790 [Thiosulfativibrio zosterae]